MVPVSAKKNKHLDHLLSTVRDFLPEQPFIYGEDEITDKSERFLASEIIREKIFRLTGQEVPYSIAVEIEKFEVEGNLRRIFAAIIVDKDSQKPMLIGKDGEKLFQLSLDKIWKSSLVVRYGLRLGLKSKVAGRQISVF
jgi:GTP-binding protein Era